MKRRSKINLAVQESQWDKSLDIKKAMRDFQQEEKFLSHRKGTFRIDKAFEEALDTILKAEPEKTKPKSR